MFGYTLKVKRTALRAGWGWRRIVFRNDLGKPAYILNMNRYSAILHDRNFPCPI